MRGLLRVTRAALWESDPDTGEMDVLESGDSELFGYPAEVWRNRASRLAIRHPEDRTLSAPLLEKLRRGETDQIDYETRIADGTGWRTLRHTVTLGTRADGRTVFRGLTVDVTGQRQQHDVYKAIFDSAVVGVGIVDRDRRIIDCNGAYEKLLGRSRSELIGHRTTEFSADDDGHPAGEMRRLVEGDVDHYTIERRYRRPDGSVIWLRVTSAPISRHDDRYVGIIEDLTEREVAEQQLQEQTALLMRAQQIGRIGSWVWYPRQNIDVWSPESQRIFGLSDEEAERGDPDSFWSVVHPDDRPWVERVTREAFARGAESELEYRIVRASDGEVRWVREQAGVELGEDGEPIRVLGVVADITERKLAEDALREKAALLERAHDAARLGSYSIDAVTRRISVSPEFSRVLGVGGVAFEIDEAEFERRFNPEDDVPAHAEAVEQARRAGGAVSFQSRMRRADGTIIHVRVRGTVELDDRGRVVREVGVVQDVSDEHALEEQLRQSQKLEAVGQLAGGIAHDFNNLLTVIAGNAQLTLMTSGDERVLSDTRELLRAAERASQLVRQLLAFSRSEATELQVVGLNDVVESVAGMLDRLIEEKVEVETDLDREDVAVLANRGRLEQVLLNLAVNARDAMPDGGRLSIRTRSHPDSATLEVSDDGVGMDEHTRSRIFDPFFTTKPRGEGTGLGLSTVYGIVKNAGGSIQVDSEVGRGTTFTITLPAVHAPELVDEADRPRGLARGMGERILLVEDEPMVRTVAAEILTRAGYATRSVADGEEALKLFDDGEEFDLLVSDFMMPKLTGLQLAEALRARGVDLPIVYTSGYSAGLELEATSDLRSAFVAKPFSGETLTEAVRRQLDRA
jgi:two-component system, cell cycle sensor histidine kinase and response regulator CckA